MSKRIALAMAAIPSRKWTYDEGNECVRAVADDGGMDEDFDPENNPSQAWDVLAWLSNNDDPVKFFRGFIAMMMREVAVQHDGTASGIRRAVVQAAERCV